MRVLSAMSGDRVEQELRSILRFPPCMKVAFGLRIGYPLAAEQPRLRVRRDLEDFTHHGTFVSKFP
jgi:hypothetical protein